MVVSCFNVALLLTNNPIVSSYIHTFKLLSYMSLERKAVPPFAQLYIQTKTKMQHYPLKRTKSGDFDISCLHTPQRDIA